MNPPPGKHLSLHEGQGLIRSQIPRPDSEEVPLKEALRRIPWRSLRAVAPIPAQAHSTMDGYALAAIDLQTASASNPVRLRVSGEIAAGCTMPPRLPPKTAIRIMTGGVLPAGADLVVPFEQCREQATAITISRPFRSGSHIRQAGTDLQKGQIIIRHGETIRAEHLPLLAATGHTAVPVCRRPRIAVLCTGSELVDGKTPPATGQTISGNRYLLDGLIREAGGIARDLGIVADNRDKLSAALSQTLTEGFQICITTGGMGPGKYDLIEETLRKLEVRILYHSLKVRPGKATLFGIAGKTLFFALPGPPPAVRLLFAELIGPAIQQAQGYKKSGPAALRARLSEPLHVKNTGVIHLKGAILQVQAGLLTVRPAGPHEPFAATLLIPANRRQMRAGELITVHLHANDAPF